VAKVKSFEDIGPLPPIILAALRRRMVALSAEIAEGVVFANGPLSHMSQALSVIPEARRNDPNFFIGNRIRTCICDDEEEAKAVLRRTVTNYALLPYYRNYWKEAGYTEEMTAIENAVADGRGADISRYLPDRWLADCTLFGPPTKIRDGIEAWRAAGIKTPVLVPLSADGDQNTALRQVFDAFAD
jgi:alkanesulfonate monooxygenase SsuD/methylene tetrahydromethanopterin reductase-like flavin-dependent oxidoreductase (luciferase family)